MKVSIAEEVFERVEEDNLSQAEQAITKGMYEEAEALGVLTLIKAGIMTQLNLMGMNIWNRLKKPVTIEDVAKDISEEYGVNYEECFCDISEFVKDLLEKGFLKND